MHHSISCIVPWAQGRIGDPLSTLMALAVHRMLTLRREHMMIIRRRVQSYGWTDTSLHGLVDHTFRVISKVPTRFVYHHRR